MKKTSNNLTESFPYVNEELFMACYEDNIPGGGLAARLINSYVHSVKCEEIHSRPNRAVVRSNILE